MIGKHEEGEKKNKKTTVVQKKMVLDESRVPDRQVRIFCCSDKNNLLKAGIMLDSLEAGSSLVWPGPVWSGLVWYSLV